MKIFLSTLLLALLLPASAHTQESWQALRLALDLRGNDLSAWEPVPGTLPSAVTVAADADPAAPQVASSDPVGEEEDDDWSFLFAPYLWAASLTGSGEIGGNRFSGTVSFSEILDNLDLAAQGYLEAGTGKWSIFFDGLFMELGDDTSTSLPGVEAEARLQMWLFQWGVTYELAQFSLERLIPESSLAIEGILANRLYRLETRVDIDPGPSEEETETWIDPVIGLRIPWELPNNFTIVTKGDIGGFGLGSHFSWQAQSLIEYDLETRVPVTLIAGYRILGFNYTQGNGADKLRLDLRFFGPVMAAALSF